MTAARPLAPGEVALYVARPERYAAGAATLRLEALCTEEERARIRRYKFEVDRRQHLVTRALVRVALSRHAAVAPEAWRFREGAHGRPEIQAPAQSVLRFNATNTSALVACAVTIGADVGIDAEPHMRAQNILEVAPSVFSDEERVELEVLANDPEASRERALALWTLKESYIKARGVGLGLPLPRISMIFGSDGEIAVRTAPEIDPDPARWRFLRQAFEDHALAVAVDGSAAPAVVFRDFEELLAT